MAAAIGVRTDYSATDLRGRPSRGKRDRLPVGYRSKRPWCAAVFSINEGLKRGGYGQPAFSMTERGIVG